MTANASMEKHRQPELLCRNSVLPTGLFNHPKLQNSDKSRRVLKKNEKNRRCVWQRWRYFREGVVRGTEPGTSVLNCRLADKI